MSVCVQNLRVQVVSGHQQLQGILRLDLKLWKRALVVRVAQLVVKVLHRLSQKVPTDEKWSQGRRQGRWQGRRTQGWGEGGG